MEENHLREIIQQIKKNTLLKNYTNIEQLIRQVEQKIDDDVFRITVAGEFSAGKSTFINAIIGKDVLKHSVEITTAAITYIYNVAEDDQKNETGRIVFYNGNSIEIKDWIQIGEYTTVQEDYSVEDEVKCVELYLHFANISIPTVIVDTPGLNGKKQKHNEITIREIEKSHTCVYLLSAKGVSLSDINFIKTLLNYQTEFVFVQNFIDMLKESENETKEIKIIKAKQIIEKMLGEYKLSYEICGISALKALVAQDKNIAYLTEMDMELGRKVKEEERILLYQESNFVEFKNILEKMFTSGKYQQIIIDSSARLLLYGLQDIVQILAHDCEEEESFYEESSGKVRERAEQRIQEMREKKLENRRNISQFIDGRVFDEKRAIKIRIREKIDSLSNEVIKKIDNEKIEWDTLNNAKNRDNIASCYEKYISAKLNQQVIPGMRSDIEVALQVLYGDALMRASKYAGFQLEKKDINLDLEKWKNMKDIHLDNPTLDGKIKAREVEMKRNKADLEKTQNEEILITKENEAIRRKYDSINKEKKQCVQYGNRELEKLGDKPEIERSREKRVREVERRGIGKIFDLFGKKTEEYYVNVEDDTKRRMWTEAHDKIRREMEIKNREYECKIDKLRVEMDMNTDRMEEAKYDKEKYEKKIREGKNELKRLNEDRDCFIRNSKQEYVATCRKRLKQEIMQKLDTSNSGEMNIYEELIEYGDRNFENNKEKIKQEVVTFYDTKSEENIRKLEKIMNDSSILEAHIAKNENELDNIKKICGMLLYIPMQEHILHGHLAPVSRKVSTTFTETAPFSF